MAEKGDLGDEEVGNFLRRDLPEERLLILQLL
jgi:hypothetical protein